MYDNCEEVTELIDKKAKRYIEIDSSTYVETGEIVTKGVPIKRDDLVAGLIDKAPNTGFHIFRDTIMCRTLRNIGVKGKIVAYLLDKTPASNIITCTIKRISEEAGVSVQAVYDCLKMLEDIGVICVKEDAQMREIFVNPGLCHRGDRYREKALMVEMSKFAKEARAEKKKSEAIE